MKFVIRFYGPMRVATGAAAPGVDAAVDPERLLPASSLKGVMRDAASRHFAPARVLAVFGGGGRPCPWAWCDAQFATPPKITRRARIRIGEGGVAADEALLTQHETWPREAEMEVEQILPLAPEEMQDHLAILVASAGAVHGLGADRRRGLGWVGITATELPAGHDAQALIERGLDLMLEVARAGDER